MSSFRFGWYDLMSTDVARSKAFYGELFGWQPRDLMAGEHPYTCFDSEGQGVGGVVHLDPAYGLASHWMPYVGVDDIEATCAAIKTNGGAVCVPPTMLGDAGTMAVAEDPQGGYFSLWQSATPAPSGEPVVSDFRFCWNQLASSDPPKVFAFYRAVFGWDAEKAEAGGEDFWMLRDGEVEVGSIRRRHDDAPRDAWLSYLQVPDVAQWQAKAEALGGETLVPKQAVPGVGEFSVQRDPGGAVFALWTNRRA